MTKDAPKDLLLEIGVEELPARFVTSALSALKSLAEASLKEAGLSYKSLDTLGTPRRLALFVHHLSPKAQDRVHENLGPAAAQAKDGQGNWTPAAQGFARGQGLTPEQLEMRETEKGPRLCAVRREPGRPSEKILPELLPALIKKIPFAKNMVWEESLFSFARPLRWLVALYGTQPVKFQLAGVKSGNKTFGLRVHGTKPVPVPAPAKYAGLLKDRLVVVDPAERRSLVERQVQQAVKPVKGRVHLEKYGDLLDEVTNLVEHPAGVLGSFDGKFLELPAEVLVTSMKKHQKYFPVFDEGGALMPHFVGVRNGISENQGVVREGYERVLAARLSDAAFFFKKDQQTALEQKAESLKSVVFFSPLTYFDKIGRVRGIVDALKGPLQLSEALVQEAGRIALVGKADLVTDMVGEFPELQGVMGRIYATPAETPAVARGIEQHYWPLTAEGALPEEFSAAVVSVADKLDSLAGNFLIGKIPSGSQDPYGLRRAAVGVLRILEARGWRVSLKALVDAAVGSFPEALAGDRAKGRQALLDFFRQRWSALAEAEGFRPDEVAAVTAAGFDDPVDARQRLKALQEVRRHPDFAPLAAAYKRVSKIVKQSEKETPLRWDGQALPVREDLLAEAAEKDLYGVTLGLREQSEPMVSGGRYAEALSLLVRFREPVDHFFEKVMVMAPEKELRTNRVYLLANIVQLFRAVADLSLLQDVPG